MSLELEDTCHSSICRESLLALSCDSKPTPIKEWYSLILHFSAVRWPSKVRTEGWTVLSSDGLFYFWFAWAPQDWPVLHSGTTLLKDYINFLQQAHWLLQNLRSLLDFWYIMHFSHVLIFCLFLNIFLSRALVLFMIILFSHLLIFIISN